jgi:hypothetical protein
MSLKYRNSNYYFNQHPDLIGFRKGVPDDIRIAVFGSTYSLYAFQSLGKVADASSFNFSLNAESLELDYQLLQQYSSHIHPGAIVIFCLAPCVCYWRYSMGSHYNAYVLLEKKNNPFFNYQEYIKSKFPLDNPIQYLKDRVHFILDDERILNLDEHFPFSVSYEQAIRNMKSQAEGWIKLFHLKDLRSSNHDKRNLNNLDYNTKVLTKMVNLCLSKGFSPVFVKIPFAQTLNYYFGKDFLDNGLSKMETDSTREEKIAMYDYRVNAEFQNNISLYCDGGFRLNKEGSRIFCKMLMSHLIEDGLLK